MAWLGIPSERCPPNHYDLLGLAMFEPDRNRILEAGKLRQQLVTRKSAGSPDGALANRLQADIRSAMNCLLNEAGRATYDQALMMQLQLAATRPPAPSMEPSIPMSQAVAVPTYGNVPIQPPADLMPVFPGTKRAKDKKKSNPTYLIVASAIFGIAMIGGVVAMLPMAPSRKPTIAQAVPAEPTPKAAKTSPAGAPPQAAPPSSISSRSSEEPPPATVSEENATADKEVEHPPEPETSSEEEPTISVSSDAASNPEVSETEHPQPETSQAEAPNSESPDIDTPEVVEPSAEQPEGPGPTDASATEPPVVDEPLPEEETQWPAEGIIKAVELKPLGTSAPGTETFRTHETLPPTWAVPHSESMRPAAIFISMKPRSAAVFSIPKGAIGFEAVAYSRLSESGKFSIDASKSKANVPPQDEAEWESLKASPAIQYGELKVALKPTHRYLRLVADARPGGNDPMYWVRPLFIGKTKRVALTEKMLAAPVTGFPNYFGFGVNHSCHFTQPLDTDGKSRCTELLYGHAPAEIALPIPSGSKRFTALVGGLEDYKDVEVSVKVDSRKEALYFTVSPNWDEVDIELPDNAKTLTLIAGPLANPHSDQVAWLYPRFHNEAKSDKEKAKAAAGWKKTLAAGRAGTDPQLRISAMSYSAETIAALGETIPGIQSWKGIALIPQLEGHSGVLLIHPDTQDAVATISFGRITSQTKGKLRLWTRNFPTHGEGPVAHRTIVKRNGELVQDFPCPFEEGWKELVIPFDHQYVTIEHQAVGWAGEHGCYDYEIVTGK